MGEVTVSKFTIDSKDAELAIQRTDRVLQLMQKTLAEAKAELSGLFVDNTGKIKDQAGALDQHQKSTVGGSKALKEFRAEQRLQSFVVRESTQAVTAMVFALNFLSQGEKDGENSTKRLTQALTAGVLTMNSVEFALFGVGQIGVRVGGTLGLMATRIAAMAGPIALIVALGATLVTFFRESNEEADKASKEGLKRFEERLKGISLQRQQREIEDLEKRVKGEKELIRILEEKKRLQGDAFRDQFRLDDAKSRLKASQDELAIRFKVREAILEEARELKKSGGILQIRKAELERLNKQLEEFRGKPEDKSALQSRIELLKREIQELEKPLQQRAQEELALAQARFELGKISEEQYLKQLETAQRVVTEEKERLAIQRSINALLEAQRDRAQIFRPDEMEVPEDVILPDVPLNEIARLRALLISDEEALVLERYRVEKDIIQTDINKAKRDGAETQILELRLAKLRKDEEKEIGDLRRKQFNQNIDQVGEIAAKLERAFVRTGDSFLGKLFEALKVAIQIAQVMKAAEAKPGGVGTLDSFNIVASILSLLGGFDGGGYTGPGRRGDVAGAVHREEVVFEEPIVRGNLAELLALRRKLQSGASVRTALAPHAMAGGTDAALVAEIRDLKRSIRELEIQVPVIIKGTLSGQKFMREEMPRYEEYRQKKELE